MNYSLNKLSVNQNISEVNKILGGPAEKKIYGEYEIFIYYIHSSIFDLFFNSARFPYIGPYPINRTGKEYWVVFKNSKLIASGFASDFDKYKNFN
jgi:hypothetical protein